MDYDNYFDEKCKEIKAKHDELEHKLGSTFLMSPKETLSPKTDIAFITLNPGGGEKEEHVPSCDKGTAYHTETWIKKGPGESPLQQQIQKLFSGLHDRIEKQPEEKSYKDLLNNTLCSQYIPFRSQRESTLEQMEESEEFSNALWKDIFSHCIKPKLVITLSKRTFLAISKIMQEEYSLLNEFEINTKWRNALTRFNVFKDSEGNICTLAGLPHLSSYKIFSATRLETKDATEKILDKMTENF